MRRIALCAACGLALFGARPAHAESDSLEDTVRNLHQRVERMERDREADRQRIRELEAQVARAPSPTAPTPAVAAEGRAANLLNPEITAFFDIGASASTDGRNEAQNRFHLRETEIDFRAPVSPRADGVLVLAIGEEIEDPFGAVDIGLAFEVEEAYLNVHTLAEGLALKAGKFRTPFGRNNLLHTHDLPQVSRPLAVQAFLGPEGLSPIGASLDWIVPTPWDAYVELSGHLMNADGGEESPILGGPGAVDPAALTHLKLFDEVSANATLELGTSFLFTRSSANRSDSAYVLGADATWQWRDPKKPDSRSLLLQGELFWSNADALSGARVVRDENRGAYVMGQYQFDANWYAGARWDYTEFPGLETRRRSDADWAASAYLTWYLSEALRLRAEYQHTERDLFGQSQHEDALLFGLTFYIGAHPAHPYWVNR